MKKLAVMLFLVTWDISTSACGKYTEPDAYGKAYCNDGNGLSFIGVKHMRKFFKSSDQVVKFVMNATNDVTEIKIQEFGGGKRP